MNYFKITLEYSKNKEVLRRPKDVFSQSCFTKTYLIYLKTKTRNNDDDVYSQVRITKLYEKQAMRQ